MTAVRYIKLTLHLISVNDKWCRFQRLSGLRGASRVDRVPGAWMSVCCQCSVLPGRFLCDGPIPRPEESYQLYCVIACDLETSENEAKTHKGL